MLLNQNLRGVNWEVKAGAGWTGPLARNGEMGSLTQGGGTNLSLAGGFPDGGRAMQVLFLRQVAQILT